jgi:hypothetical protein
MLMNIAIALTGRYWLANIQTRNGVTIGAASVVTLVQATLRATSPLRDTS